MKIDLKKILMAVLPFLFSMAKKVWANFTPGQKDALSKAVLFAQLIKTNLSAAPVSVIGLLSTSLNLPTTTITAALTGVAYSIGHPEFSAEDVIKYYQDKAAKGLDDMGWANLWNSFAGLLAPHMNTEPIDWKAIALGAVEVAYDMVIKK